MKRSIFFITTALIIGIFPINTFAQHKTQVLVIGTIHAGHESNPNYSNQDLVNILGTYNPDVICVEIPPSYFKKRSYLKEMMLATIYGNDHHKSVYPIDWWSGNPRAERAEYVKTEDYQIKKRAYDSLVNASVIMRNFTEKYGETEQILSENKVGYEFINGKAYNDYIRESYAISLRVYGDGCMNLYSEQRNKEMMALIDRAIQENSGKRIIVLTGAEHKYYFDDAFAKREDVNLIDFASLGRLQKTAISQNLSDYLTYGLAKGYYDFSDSSSVDHAYQEALLPLIHGRNMDVEPHIIPQNNIEKAQHVLAEWAQIRPNSVMFLFEKAWVEFLVNDDRAAVKTLESIENRLIEIPDDNPMKGFFMIFYWRNLGFCYDGLGEREKAVNAYKQGKKLCVDMGMNEQRTQMIYADYENTPYQKIIKY